MLKNFPEKAGHTSVCREPEVRKSMVLLKKYTFSHSFWHIEYESRVMSDGLREVLRGLISHIERV